MTAYKFYIFLDIDGVIIRQKYPYFEPRTLFEHWVRRHTDVAIILISSWCENHSLVELKELFSNDISQLILDGIYDPKCYRDELIIRYIQNHQIDRYCVFDDDKRSYANGFVPLIPVLPRQGMNAHHLDMLCRRINCSH